MNKRSKVLWQVLATALVFGFASLALTGCEDLFGKDEPGPAPEKKGQFSYTITWPDTVTAEISLQKLPEMSDIALASISSAKANGKSKTLSEMLELDAGAYFFHAHVSNDDSYADINEPVQVTSGKTTAYTKTFTNDDLVSGNQTNTMPITSVDVIVIAPIKDAVPNTAAEGGDNFTIGAVSWSPSPDRFMGGTEYTASVLLKADTGYTFTGLVSAKINGETATIAYNNGSAILISYAFRATEPVTFISNSYLATPSNKEIIYAYTYEGYEFYYVYLGQLANIPLYSFKTQIHDGIRTDYTVTVTDEVKNSVRDTVSNSVDQTIGVITNNTISESNNKTIGVELTYKTGTPFVSTKVKASGELSVQKEVSTSQTGSSEKTTSFGNTKEEASEHAMTTMESTTFHLTREEPTGYYKYTMFGVSDVFLSIIRDPKTDERYYEFKEFILDDSKTPYSWGFDYTKELPFKKNDASYLILEPELLDNLPEPTKDLTNSGASNNFTVTNADDWNRAVDLVKSGGGTAAEPRAYTINVIGNVVVTGGTNNTFGNTANITVTLNGNGKLFLSSQGSLLNIGGNQTVCIDGAGLVLQGLKSGQNSSTLDNYRTIITVNANGKLELKNGKISDNKTTVNGSGVNVLNSGVFTMTGGSINDNTTTANGGGVYVEGGTFTFNGGTISENTAVNGGGVIAAGSSTFAMNGGTISENTASSNNGGVGVYQNSTFTMAGGTISGNTANRGGGVVAYSSAFTMAGGTISGNTSKTTAGGVGLDSKSTFTMNDGIISYNTATAGNSGGGVHLMNGDTFTMNGGTISGNTAYDGGGVLVSKSCTFTMTNGTISGNTATHVGGGVRFTDGTFTMTGGTISQNTSTEYGGGCMVTAPYSKKQVVSLRAMAMIR
jgi:hypothetical protein